MPLAASFVFGIFFKTFVSESLIVIVVVFILNTVTGMKKKVVDAKFLVKEGRLFTSNEM